MGYQWDFAVVWFVNAGEQFHQGGLSRPVFAHHRVNLAAADIKTHFVERGYAAKTLREAIELD